MTTWEVGKRTGFSHDWEPSARYSGLALTRNFPHPAR